MLRRSELGVCCCDVCRSRRCNIKLVESGTRTMRINKRRAKKKFGKKNREKKLRKRMKSDYQKSKQNRKRVQIYKDSKKKWEGK